MYWVILIVVSLLVAWLLMVGNKNRRIPGGYWVILIGALIGAWLGDLLLGNWAWMLAGYNVIAGIIGAGVIAWLDLLILGSKESTDL